MVCDCDDFEWKLLILSEKKQKVRIPFFFFFIEIVWLNSNNAQFELNERFNGIPENRSNAEN